MSSIPSEILKKEIKYSYTLQNRADDKNLIIALFVNGKAGKNEVRFKLSTDNGNTNRNL